MQILIFKIEWNEVMWYTETGKGHHVLPTPQFREISYKYESQFLSQNNYLILIYSHQTHIVNPISAPTHVS